MSLTNIDGPGSSGDLKNLGARYVANEQWIIEGDYIDGDGSDVKALGLGAYLTDAISLIARYATADEIDAFGATLKGFSPGANNGGLAYEVSLTRAEEEDEFLGTSESETTYGGALTYYTNERFGIGVAYEDRESSSTIGLEFDYFFTPNFAGSVGFVSIDADESDGNADGFLLGLTGRF